MVRILEIGGFRLLIQKCKIDGIQLLNDLANEGVTTAEVAGAKGEK